MMSHDKAQGVIHERMFTNDSSNSNMSYLFKAHEQNMRLTVPLY